MNGSNVCSECLQLIIMYEMTASHVVATNVCSTTARRKQSHILIAAGRTTGITRKPKMIGHKIMSLMHDFYILTFDFFW